jgi:hypothetical protein
VYTLKGLRRKLKVIAPKQAESLLWYVKRVSDEPLQGTCHSGDLDSRGWSVDKSVSTSTYWGAAYSCVRMPLYSGTNRATRRHSVSKLAGWKSL